MTLTLLLDSSWHETLISSKPAWLITGIILVPLLQFFYPDIKKWFTDRAEAKRILSNNIDPIVHVSDELYGKILDMAKHDFKGTYTIQLSDPGTDLIERIYVLYLFCSFLGRIAIVRQESNSFSKITQLRRGRRFMTFIMAFETRTNNRIIDRASQRLIGDAMLRHEKDKFRTLNLYEFRNELNISGNGLKEIIKPLDNVLFQSNKREIRQKILLFGTLLKCFTDYFDPRFRITKNRDKSCNHKLSPKTRNELKNKIFELYIPFIQVPEHYYMAERKKVSARS